MIVNIFTFKKCIFIDTHSSFDGESFEMWKERFESFISK